MFYVFTADCNGVQCKYGSDCVRGMCVCPQVCPKAYTPVCGDDGETYHNECEMRRAACRLNKDIEMIRSGDCNDDIESGSGGKLTKTLLITSLIKKVLSRAPCIKVFL